jgi:arabinose-5-phosphate isomerase
VTVDEVMTRQPKTVSPDMSAGAAIAYLNENKIGALVVVEGERPVGVVHFHDLLRIGAA